MTRDAIARAGSPTMRGLVQTSLDGPDDLVLVTDLPVPSPASGEYLIKVGAAGLNFADVMQTRGTYAGGPCPPYVAGFEAAGEIVRVGSGITDPLPVGTRVIGAGSGAFASYMVMSESAVVPAPRSWSAAATMGLVLNWATALAAIKPLGSIAPGEWVLVHAAAGGVGQAAIRLAQHYGARVVATASPHKHDLVTGLGAEVVLDSTRDDLPAEVLRHTGGVDLVLESVGRSTFRASLAAAKPFRGRVIVFGAASGDASISTHELVFEHRVTIKGLHIGALAELAPELFVDLLAELDDLIDAGVYPPGAPEVHALGDGPAVLRALASGRTQGKLAIDPWL